MANIIPSNFKKVNLIPAVSGFREPYAFTNPKKNSYYIQILQFVKDHPLATRKEVHEAIFGKERRYRGDILAHGYYNNFWIMARRNHLVNTFVDEKRTYHFTIGEYGNTLLKEANLF